LFFLRFLGFFCKIFSTGKKKDEHNLSKKFLVRGPGGPRTHFFFKLTIFRGFFPTNAPKSPKFFLDLSNQRDSE